MPRYAEGDPLHADLAALAERAETVAAGVEIPDGLHFVTVRRRIRAALAADGVAGAIDRLVEHLLG